MDPIIDKNIVNMHRLYDVLQFLSDPGLLDKETNLILTDKVNRVISVPNSSDGPIFEKRRAKDGRFFNKNTGVRRA